MVISRWNGSNSRRVQRVWILQVRVAQHFSGAISLKREAAIFGSRWRIPWGGEVLLYERPEQRRKWKLSGQKRLLRRATETICSREGEKRRGRQWRSKPRHVRVSILVFIHSGSEPRTETRRGLAVSVWCDDVLFVFCLHFLRWLFAALQSFVPTGVPWKRGASLAFTVLCPPVFEPHLHKKPAQREKEYLHLGQN